MPFKAIVQDADDLMVHISVLMDSDLQTAVTACSALWVALSYPEVEAQLRQQGLGAQLDAVLLQCGGDSSQQDDAGQHVGGSADTKCAEGSAQDLINKDPMPVAGAEVKPAACVDMVVDAPAAGEGDEVHAQASMDDQDVDMAEVLLGAAANVNTAEVLSGSVTLADLQHGLQGLIGLQILTAVASWRYGPLASASTIKAARLLKHCLDPVHLWDTIDIAQGLNLTLLEIAICLKQLLPIAGPLLHHEQPPEAAARVDAITRLLDAQIAAG